MGVRNQIYLYGQVHLLPAFPARLRPPELGGSWRHFPRVRLEHFVSAVSWDNLVSAHAAFCPNDLAPTRQLRKSHVLLQQVVDQVDSIVGHDARAPTSDQRDLHCPSGGLRTEEEVGVHAGSAGAGTRAQCDVGHR